MMEHRLIRSLEEGVRFSTLICGYLLLFLSILVGFEVLARKVFGFSMQGAYEIGGYIFAITGVIGFSYALLRRAHTRIDIFLSRMPEGAQRVLNVLSIISMAAFAVFMAWRASAALMETLEYGSIANSPLQTPLWIPQSLWLIGLIVFAVTSVSLAISAVYLLVREPEAVNRRFGLVTGDQESKETSV